MADRLAERRKQAQRAEARATMAARASLEMAKDLEAVRQEGFREGFDMALIECSRLARSAGSVGTIRSAIENLIERRKKAVA